MVRLSLMIVMVAVPVAGCTSPGTISRAGSESPVRIGVYETRAIAVAWAASEYNTRVGAMQAEYKEAEAAGDTARMAALKEEGSRRQDRLHEQGFGRAAVDDLLEPIGARIPEICTAAGVERILPIWSREAVGVATVDVTDLLVAEYQPSEKTRRTIKELRKHRPIDPPYHKH